jgi:hypothetical protein
MRWLALGLLSTDIGEFCMKAMFRTSIGLAAAILAVLALAVPVQAATAGWDVVFTHHYGVSTNYSGYTALAVPGTGDAWAFGTTSEAGEPAPGTPVAEHWNGTKWSGSTLPSGLTSEINAASVVSADSVWAVTEVGGDILHWNGSKWSVADDVPGSDLLFSGITAVNDSDVWAFGSAGVGPGLGTWHYNGHTWTQVTGSADGLVSASAVSASNIWAIGSSAEGPAGDILTHYTGSTWQTVTAPALTGLEFSDILALSSTDVWAAAGNGQGGDAQLVHFNGSQWTSVKAPYSGLVFGDLASDGQGGFWLTAFEGSKNWAVHLTAGGQWSRASIASRTLDALALLPGTTSLWAVGSVATATPASNARIWAYGTAGTSR